jgi:glycosyltransferase involved in cell wall biosynthesis
MPKILRIINRFNLGGPTYNVAYLSRYLAPEFETLLVGGAKDASEDSSEFILEKLGLTPTIIPEMKREINLRDDRVAYLKIKKLIRDFKPDIVHTHASKAGTLGRLAANACQVPLILHTFHGHVFHSYFGRVQTTLYKNIERYLATKSTCIIAISELQKKELSDVHHICPPEKIEVIPLGFDLEKFRENKAEKRNDFRKTYQIGENEIVIMIIGRLVPVKNHRLFLEAIRFVKQHSSRRIRGMIVGDGEERDHIQKMASEFGLAYSNGTDSSPGTDLTFTSWIHNADWACAGADIIALCSFNEGTPVSLIEAQAAGKPIVSTNTGGIENVVIDRITASLSKPGDSSDFCQKLLELVENEELRTKMSLAGWEHVRSTFHYTRLVEDMKKLYHRLLLSANLSNFQ